MIFSGIFFATSARVRGKLPTNLCLGFARDYGVGGKKKIATEESAESNRCTQLRRSASWMNPRAFSSGAGRKLPIRPGAGLGQDMATREREAASWNLKIFDLATSNGVLDQDEEKIFIIAGADHGLTKEQIESPELAEPTNKSIERVEKVAPPRRCDWRGIASRGRKNPQEKNSLRIMLRLSAIDSLT